MDIVLLMAEMLDFISTRPGSVASEADICGIIPEADKKEVRQAGEALVQRGLLTVSGKTKRSYSLVSVSSLAALALNLGNAEAKKAENREALDEFYKETKARNLIKGKIEVQKSVLAMLKERLRESERRLGLWGNGEVPEVSVDLEFGAVAQLALFEPSKKSEAKDEGPVVDADFPDKPESSSQAVENPPVHIDDEPALNQAGEPVVYELAKAL